MEEIKFIEYRPEHAYQMDWKDKDEFLGLIKNHPQYFYSLAAMDVALTVVRSNSILGILTVIPSGQKHCRVAIFMANAYIEKFDKDLYKITKKVIDDLSCDCERVSTEIKASNEKLIKLMKRLGFKQEGVMRKYGYNGEDYILYSIVKGD